MGGWEAPAAWFERRRGEAERVGRSSPWISISAEIRVGFGVTLEIGRCGRSSSGEWRERARRGDIFRSIGTRLIRKYLIIQ